jgi:hypothetical protein
VRAPTILDGAVLTLSVGAMALNLRAFSEHVSEIPSTPGTSVLLATLSYLICLLNLWTFALVRRTRRLRRARERALHGPSPVVVIHRLGSDQTLALTTELLGIGPGGVVGWKAEGATIESGDEVMIAGLLPPGVIYVDAVDGLMAFSTEGPPQGVS